MPGAASSTPRWRGCRSGRSDAGAGAGHRDRARHAGAVWPGQGGPGGDRAGPRGLRGVARAGRLVRPGGLRHRRRGARRPRGHDRDGARPPGPRGGGHHAAVHRWRLGRGLVGGEGGGPGHGVARGALDRRHRGAADDRGRDPPRRQGLPRELPRAPLRQRGHAEAQHRAQDRRRRAGRHRGRSGGLPRGRGPSVGRERGGRRGPGVRLAGLPTLRQRAGDRAVPGAPGLRILPVRQRGPPHHPPGSPTTSP